MMSNKLDHPCRETCSGWQQGYDRGASEMKAKADKLAKRLDQLLYTPHDLITIERAEQALKEYRGEDE